MALTLRAVSTRPGSNQRRTLGVFAIGILAFAACSSDTSTTATTAAATTTTAAAVTDSTASSDSTSTSNSAASSDSGAPEQSGPIDPGMTLSSEHVVTSAEVSGTTEATVGETTDPIGTGSVIGPYTSEVYSDPAHWICRGDMDDVCDDAYPLARVTADGATTVDPSTPAVDPSIDCFYVYPTSSGDQSFNSDLSADSEIGVTQVQVARFDQVCRMYAPTYRSVTVAGLFGSADGDFATGWNIAYDDVLDAWRSYLANDNHGRPVVIISHSQGSFHVTRLLREEIDPNPAERELVVSAIIAGTSFQVAKGKNVGGDTQHMPLCTANDQFGCIVTFQTFRDSVPPQSGALFGRPGADTDAACTNPAALASGGPAVLSSAMANGAWVLTDPAAGAKITNQYVDVPGLITAECKVTADGYHYLAITVNANPGDPRGDQIPGDGATNWGLHSVDLNLTQGSLIQLVRAQSAAYLAAKAG